MKRSFRFNKLYVIESLEADEKQTGTELYNDLLRWKVIGTEKLSAEIINANSKKEFFSIIQRIQSDCKKEDIFPIIHLEIHGSKYLDGLVLNSGELIRWMELYDDLVRLNESIGNNLFLTMAVCHGAHLMQLIKIDKPSPYWGIIGSFDEIYQQDILVRYNQFYDEFLTSFDLDKSIERLQKANEIMPADYRYINSEETFEKVYNDYLNEQFSTKAIKKRANDTIIEENLNIVTRNDKRKFYRDFRKRLEKTKKHYFQKHHDIFFMIDKFPNNKNRFKVNVTP
ncbi:hypothetical protein SAMN05192588_1059 [Nonlabens sp. Hel1_33_55]|uniref:hypothetical protein n=1 Tax=Nonlabens sp. Hel1_33_55 TaxID=1336802 RepID=UPI000875C8A2|nr:hypothetical protein [Nonlabens sp. Hel1_33_55]SCY08472.1 hypothetical protein SAMN05192588_1059 [Nonlabens sp. Hel1_33_55]